MALRLGDQWTDVAAKSPKVVKRSFIQDFIDIIVVRGLANACTISYRVGYGA
jgi:hypothetical protein